MADPAAMIRWLLALALGVGLGAPFLVAGEPAVPPGVKVFLVTGSTDGLGREVARRLAATGAHVIVHGRNAERGGEIVREIQALGRGGARFYRADFASLAAVDQLAADVRRDYDRLDGLINNAGIWLAGNQRQLSGDGHEMHLAVNYLAPYRLTRQLLPLLERSGAARVINVASVAQTPLDFDNLMLARNYSDGRAYGTSKLALVMFTLDLAADLAGKRVTVLALHPATLMATTMVESRGLNPQATVAEGADAVMHLVTAPDLVSGTYFQGRRPAEPNAQARDAGARERLRRAAESLLIPPAGR